ncbi:MAG: glycosyltransferase family 2 protein [Saprospiraceae bacterium]
MKALSVVIIANNERENIPKCIRAAQQLTEDIVVVDSFSTDDTVDVARALGARVFQKEWAGYAQNKNYGNQQAKYDWILSIDADEILSKELVQSIETLDLQKETVYSLDRLNNFCGQWIKHCGWYPDWKKRIFNRNEVQWEGDYVHEILAVPAQFKVKKLRGILYHYSYDSLEDHASRLQIYAKLAAEDLHAQGKSVGPLKLWFSPIIRFIKTYFLKLGILDGRNGLIISRSDAYQTYRKYELLRELNRK